MQKSKMSSPKEIEVRIQETLKMAPHREWQVPGQYPQVDMYWYWYVLIKTNSTVD